MQGDRKGKKTYANRESNKRTNQLNKGVKTWEDQQNLKNKNLKSTSNECYRKLKTSIVRLESFNLTTTSGVSEIVTLEEVVLLDK